MTLHRIQAPEGAAPPPTPAAPVTTATVASDSNNSTNANDPEGATNAEDVNGGRNRFAGLRSVTEGFGQMFRGRPAVNCTSPFFFQLVPASILPAYPKPLGIVMALLFFLLGPLLFTPSVFPIFLTSLYSFWVPQIWRNARRGNGRALGWGFVLGMSGGRLVLPLCEFLNRSNSSLLLLSAQLLQTSLQPVAQMLNKIKIDAFAYPNNMFFTEPKRWVWGLVAWQVVQVGVLYAQERFGPAFL